MEFWKALEQLYRLGISLASLNDFGRIDPVKKGVASSTSKAAQKRQPNAAEPSQTLDMRNRRNVLLRATSNWTSRISYEAAEHAIYMLSTNILVFLSISCVWGWCSDEAGGCWMSCSMPWWLWLLRAAAGLTTSNLLAQAGNGDLGWIFSAESRTWCRKSCRWIQRISRKEKPGVPTANLRIRKATDVNCWRARWLRFTTMASHLCTIVRIAIAKKSRKTVSTRVHHYLSKLVQFWGPTGVLPIYPWCGWQWRLTTS